MVGWRGEWEMKGRGEWGGYRILDFLSLPGGKG